MEKGTHPGEDARGGFQACIAVPLKEIQNMDKIDFRHERDS